MTTGHDLDSMALWKTVIRSSERLFVLQHGTVLSETCSRYLQFIHETALMKYFHSLETSNIYYCFIPNKFLCENYYMMKRQKCASNEP